LEFSSLLLSASDSGWKNSTCVMVLYIVPGTVSNSHFLTLPCTSRFF
jgi:hypothetical protein